MARRIFFLFWPLLFLVLALTRPTNSAPLSLPLRLDVGGSVPYVAQDGDVYLPDQPWTPGNPAGYLGGYVQLTDWWDGLGGTADPTLHQSYLIDWQEYRISQLPAGSYIVTLHFSDSQAHRAGQSLFSIAMEGQTVLNHLDLFATVGGDYALTYRFLVPVYDGELNINATIDEGHVYLAALGVDEAVADTTPAPRPGCRATAATTPGCSIGPPMRRQTWPVTTSTAPTPRPGLLPASPPGRSPPRATPTRWPCRPTFTTTV